MKTKHRLDDEDRDYLRRIEDLAYGNPFGPDRVAALEILLPGHRTRGPLDDAGELARAALVRLERFDRDAPARIDDFAAADRPLLETAYFYVVYHRFLDDLDGLIARQIESETPVRVPFHDAYFEETTRRGIAEERAVLFLGFFFQLRRAFYFLVSSLAGESPCMHGLRHALWNNLFTHDMKRFSLRMWSRMEDFSTLLLGETGTGKGNAAAAIGRSAFIPYDSSRRQFVASFTRTFVSLNLLQFPETLIESELFGHHKGAFTGAVGHHDGVFALCDAHGALFLDEIGEIGVPVQIKLLQVLQERTFTPIGSHESKRFDGRVIAATNRTLDELRHTRFRDDFFYRLCSDVIAIPSLRTRIRERPEELGELCGAILERVTGESSDGDARSVRAAIRRDLGDDYPWPGNVRELEQAIRRILLTGSCATNRSRQPVDREDAFIESVREGRLGADELVGRYCAMLHARDPVYTAIAASTGLDRRTVRKHVLRYSGWSASPAPPRE